jgi:hypothetical protein
MTTVSTKTTTSTTTRLQRALELEPTIPTETFTPEQIVAYFCPSDYGLKDYKKNGSICESKCSCKYCWNEEWNGW